MTNRKAYDSAIVALNLLVLWAGLSGIWNIYGGLQLLYGERALGPTPGLTTAFFMFALAVGFIVTSSYWSIAYIALASFAGVMATMNILHITDGSAELLDVDVLALRCHRHQCEWRGRRNSCDRPFASWKDHQHPLHPPLSKEPHPVGNAACMLMLPLPHRVGAGRAAKPRLPFFCLPRQHYAVCPMLPAHQHHNENAPRTPFRGAVYGSVVQDHFPYTRYCGCCSEHRSAARCC